MDWLFTVCWISGSWAFATSCCVTRTMVAGSNLPDCPGHWSVCKRFCMISILFFTFSEDNVGLITVKASAGLQHTEPPKLSPLSVLLSDHDELIKGHFWWWVLQIQVVCLLYTLPYRTFLTFHTRQDTSHTMSLDRHVSPWQSVKNSSVINKGEIHKIVKIVWVYQSHHLSWEVNHC